MIGSFVRWTPDGAGLLFAKRLLQLWRLDIHNGKQQQMGLSARGLVDAVINPDRSQIAFTVKRPGHQIWVLENFLPD